MFHKKHCQGCRADFYNGKNMLGIKACFNRRWARLATRWRVHRQALPTTARQVRLPQCYHSDEFVYYDHDPRTPEISNREDKDIDKRPRPVRSAGTPN